LFVEELRARWPTPTRSCTGWRWTTSDPNWPALLTAVPSLKERRLRACGPPPMVEAVRQALERAGLSGDLLQVDRFDLRH
jgi:NAD(P)H-flavin reductase